jgi:hemolysin type calcium-binding protein
VIGSRASLFACLAVCAAVAALLALPAAVTAHQRATLSGGTLRITGDHPLGDIPKPNDLVTIDYDASAKEFIFGQDIFGTHPSQCSSDAHNPQRIIHCPASQISSIVVQAGIGSDTVCADATTGAPKGGDARAACKDVQSASDMPLKVSMGPGADRFQGGPEKDNANGGSGSDQLYGGGGADKLFGGPAPDKIFGGPGNDQCHPGGGVGKVRGC